MAMMTKIFSYFGHTWKQSGKREMNGKKKKKKKITWNFCISELVTILNNWISFFLGNHLGSCSICLLRRWKIGDIYQPTTVLHMLKFWGQVLYMHPNSCMYILTMSNPQSFGEYLQTAKQEKKNKKLMHSGLMWDTSHMQETFHHNSIHARSVEGLWHATIIISSNS